MLIGADVVLFSPKDRRRLSPIDLELASPARRRVPVRMAMSQLPGDPPRLVVVVQDITDVREAEARRELMMREVEHRAKNTLAVIQTALSQRVRGDRCASARARSGSARCGHSGDRSRS